MSGEPGVGSRNAFDRWLRMHPEASRWQSWDAGRMDGFVEARQAHEKNIDTLAARLAEAEDRERALREALGRVRAIRWPGCNCSVAHWVGCGALVMADIKAALAPPGPKEGKE